jgi:hypothetical protein
MPFGVPDQVNWALLQREPGKDLDPILVNVHFNKGSRRK